jgi:hypothetical protein
MNCATTYIVNPKTNKCVKKTGKIGKNITEIKYCRLILNPKTGKSATLKYAWKATPVVAKKK